MNIRQKIAEMQNYGTSEGAQKAWDTRGRKGRSGADREAAMDSVLHHIRNHNVGDEEETRIADEPKLNPEARKLADDGEYDDAIHSHVQHTLDKYGIGNKELTDHFEKKWLPNWLSGFEGAEEDEGDPDEEASDLRSGLKTYLATHRAGK